MRRDRDKNQPLAEQRLTPGGRARRGLVGAAALATAVNAAGMKVVITDRTRSYLDEAMKLLQGAAERVLHAVRNNETIGRQLV
jgi:hypothetical protein